MHLKMVNSGYELFDMICYIIALGLSLALFIPFLWAYFFNNYWFTVSINDYGEADIELLLLCISIPFLFFNLVLKYKRIKKICMRKKR